jgi:Uma2 family endonuclease
MSRHHVPDLLTAEQFAQLPEEGHYRLELKHGQVVREPPPGADHGYFVAELVSYLRDHVKKHRLGRVFADVGTITERDPDTVRGPDIAFVSRARLEAYPAKPYFGIAPELCVEVLSPSNRPGEIKEKVGEYFAAGARLVWMVDPMRERVTVYRSSTDLRVLTNTEQLDGGDVLPGFQLPLAQLFDQSL